MSFGHFAQYFLKVYKQEEIPYVYLLSCHNKIPWGFSLGGIPQGIFWGFWRRREFPGEFGDTKSPRDFSSPSHHGNYYALQDTMTPHRKKLTRKLFVCQKKHTNIFCRCVRLAPPTSFPRRCYTPQPIALYCAMYYKVSCSDWACL